MLAWHAAFPHALANDVPISKHDFVACLGEEKLLHGQPAPLPLFARCRSLTCLRAEHARMQQGAYVPVQGVRGPSSHRGEIGALPGQVMTPVAEVTCQDADEAAMLVIGAIRRNQPLVLRGCAKEMPCCAVPRAGTVKA